MTCSSEHSVNEVNERTRDDEELNTELIKELDAELDRVIEEAMYDDVAAYLEAQLCGAFHDGDGDTMIWNNSNRNLWEDEKEDDGSWEHDRGDPCVESESGFESDVSSISNGKFSEGPSCSPIADMDTLIEQFGDPSVHGHHSRVTSLALMCEGLSLSSTQLSSVDADVLLKDIYAR